MTNEYVHPTNGVRLPWLVLVILSLPVAISAHPTVDNAQKPAPSLEESPFSDFEPLEGFEASPSGIVADTDRAEPDEESRPPDEARLRFDFDQTKTYKIRNGMRIAYDHRPDFSPTYQSGLFVEYYPIDEDYRTGLDRWPIHIDSGEDNKDDTTLVRVQTGNAVGAFDSPQAFGNVTGVHSLLREAKLTFRISDRGPITDVQIHPPTNPLARSSIEEFIRLLAASHPHLPDDDVAPGDRWTDTLEWSVGDDTAELEHSVELTYTFARWASCGGNFCAVIDIEQDIDASGTYRSGSLRTEGTSKGEAVGQVLFDIDNGRVIDARWNLDSRGAILTVRKEEPDSEPLHDFGFNLEVDTAVTLH